MKEPKDKNSTRLAVSYFAIVLLGPITLLACWISLKIGLEHKLAGRNAAGYAGLVAGPAPELLLMGSSHTRQSYDVAPIEAATGRSAYILSYSSLDLEMMDIMLREILQDPAHRPRILVLEAYSAKLAREPVIGDYRLFFDVPPTLKLKVMSTHLQFHPGLSGYLDLFDLVVNLGTDQIVTYPINSRILAGISYKGSYQGHVVRGLTSGDFQSLHADIASNKPDPVQFAALLDIIQLCKQHGVQLILAESPMPKPISSKPEIQSLKSVFRQASAANGLPYLDGDEAFPTDDPALFADAGHLSTAGRSLYTSKMIDRLTPLIGRGEMGRRAQIANRPPTAFVPPHNPTLAPSGLSQSRQ